MDILKIDRVIELLCDDITKTIKVIKQSDMDEAELWLEMFMCILGGGVRYEVALSYASKVSQEIKVTSSLLKDKKLEEKLFEILNCEVLSSDSKTIYKKYRFPKIRAKYLAQTIKTILSNFGSISSFLSGEDNPYEARRKLIKYCSGIGPKQASHYLKNIGVTEDFAIIDVHILRYIELNGFPVKKQSDLSNIKKYEQIESVFFNLVRKFHHSISIVDQSIWFVMRSLRKGYTI